MANRAEIFRRKQEITEQIKALQAEDQELNRKLAAPPTGPKGYCPYCFEEHGEASRLIGQPGDPVRPKVDIFKCRVCERIYP